VMGDEPGAWTGARAGLPSPKWVFVVRALVTVKGTGAAKDELNKM
jgi:hypothetical protein